MVEMTSVGSLGVGFAFRVKECNRLGELMALVRGSNGSFSATISAATGGPRPLGRRISPSDARVSVDVDDRSESTECLDGLEA